MIVVKMLCLFLFISYARFYSYPTALKETLSDYKNDPNSKNPVKSSDTPDLTGMMDIFTFQAISAPVLCTARCS